MSSRKLATSISLLLLITATVIADLNADKQALLAFAASIPNGKKLNWSSDNPVCSSWVGVRCTPDRTNVVALRLPGASLHGPIPVNTLGKLNALQVLSLRSNGLNSNIPSDFGSLSSLRFLFLQHNNLSGGLSTLLAPGLTSFDLSFNSFAGEIPLSIQNLTQLKSLYLQHNFFSGPIPELKLPKLKHLNLSSNNFSGPIPISFQKFPKESFLGNSLLCGIPLEQCPGLPPPSSPSPLPPREHKKSFWKKLSLKAIIAISTGVLALMLLVVIILLVYILRRKGSRPFKKNAIAIARVEKSKEDLSSGVQENEKNKLVFFEGCSFNFDLDDLLRASAEVLGKGSYGTTYKAVLEDGTIVVVKRLKEMAVGKREFVHHMEVIRRIGQHPYVVPLRAYYYSKDEKILVYDYMPNGSFATLLHGNNKNTKRTPLDWVTRVKIALETGRGISRIHAEDGRRFVHGNIKSSNILLTQDLHASVTDFGLSSFMSSLGSPSRILVGYRAPETIQSRKFTQKSDIYSFGVLLLELLTGKAPLQSPGRRDITDLPRWVQSVVQEEWTAEVFDTELMRCQINEEDLVRMLQIAMACVAEVPDQRPNIEEVIKMIEEASWFDSENGASLEDKSKDSEDLTP